MSVEPDEPDAPAPRELELSCPRCAAPRVWIEEVTITPRSCVAMPGLERIRCRACGAEGSRWRRAGATVVWRA